MDTKTAEILCNATAAFYRAQAASFSATRHAPWPGWRRCVAEALDAFGAPASRSHDEDAEAPASPSGNDVAARSACEPPACLRVFDLACGNLRFEAFLTDALPATRLEVYAVDNCDALACDESLASSASVVYESSDVIRGLIDGAPLALLHHAPAVDLAVSFGFFHHVPGVDLRLRVLEGLVDAVRPGGMVAVSLWQFMKSDALAAKAAATHPRALESLGIDPASLDENDWLLGWKDAEDTWRYCHHFADEEIDRLIAAVANRARLLARFEADGRTGDMNTYLIFQRTDAA